MSRLARPIGNHPVLSALLLSVLTVVGVGGWYLRQQVVVPDTEVMWVVPEAPRLSADGPSETLYRVDPSRSTVTYEVDEELAGTSHTATGATSGIAGDLVIDAADPASSQAGTIVVNVEQLTSDEELRDRRLRHDFLESDRYPLATFEPGAIDGLPARIDEGAEIDVEIPGELTVKETTAPVTLTGTAVLADGEVHLTAATTVQLSTFDVGPIELIGFVSTGDDATLTFDITFVDPAEVDIPTAVAAPGEEQVVAGDVESPSFEAAVMPVLAENSASCHNEGGVGAAVWPLDTAGDAAEVASGLALVTGSGFMPPWPASDEGVPFAHVRSLSSDEIADIAAWADAGGPLDVDPDTRIEAPDPAQPPLQPDIELAMAEPYVGSLDVRNDYRCFVLDPGLTETTWVSGYEFLPDQTEIVHHALAFDLDADMRSAVEATDAAAPGPGWQCYTGTGVGGAASFGGSGGGSTQFMAWAPGQEATRFPEGTAMRLDPGDMIVLQVHYHFAHDTPADASAMRFELAPDGEAAREVSFRTYLAPAEIPCRDGLEEGPLCDRSAALVDLSSRYGPAGALIPFGLHRMCGTDAADAAGMTDGVASAGCDHTIRSDAEVLAIFGHMHEIGTEFRMTLNPGTPDEQVLLDIPKWDFGWQLNYEPAERLVVRAGDTLRVECTWDRALLPVPEDRYITWAEGTEDEMCYSALTTVPVEP